MGWTPKVRILNKSEKYGCNRKGLYFFDKHIHVAHILNKSNYFEWILIRSFFKKIQGVGWTPVGVDWTPILLIEILRKFCTLLLVYSHTRSAGKTHINNEISYA